MKANILKFITSLALFFIATFTNACSFGPDSDIFKSPEENFANKENAILFELVEVAKNGDSIFNAEQYLKGDAPRYFVLQNPGHSCALTFSKDYIGQYFLFFYDGKAWEFSQATPYERFETLTSANEFIKNLNDNSVDNLIACTADAMQCPDGSYVGRSGPNCEFSCPEVKVVEPKVDLPQICTTQYEPVCAQKTIYCIQAPCPQPELETFSNSCVAKSQGANIVHMGECETIDEEEIQDLTAPKNCKSWFDGCNNCFRFEEEGALACTRKFCQTPEKPKCLEYFEDKESISTTTDNLFVGPTTPPEVGFIEPTSPPPKSRFDEEEKGFFSKIVSWFKSLFN